MKLIQLFALAGISLLTLTSVKAQNVDDIMKKHEVAVGGINNWNKIKTLKMSGSMAIQGTDISITQTYDLGNAMRMDISAMGMNGFQIVTTKEGWMYMPMQGSTKIDTLPPDVVMVAQSSKAEYAGTDTVNNTPCYKIKFTDKDGNESTSYFDKSTYYLLRTETKVKQDDQETEMAVVYNNYKHFDEGVVMPMSMTAAGIEITYKSVEINKPVDQGIFVPKIDK
jgi:outer membrane lipoprotein-sorting protein